MTDEGVVSLRKETEILGTDRSFSWLGVETGTIGTQTSRI